MRYRMFFLLLPLLSLGCSLAAAAPEQTFEPSGREAFQQGRQALEQSRYDDAIRLFTRASAEYPLLADYALLSLAEAQHLSGDHAESFAVFRSLLDRNPRNQVRKKALLGQLREAGETDSPDLVSLFERYLASYPDDDDIAFAFALYLRKNGQAARANDLFQQLYVKAGPRASLAKQELGTREIPAGDVVARAGNLMKRYDFSDAERELKALMAKADVPNRTEAQKQLATSLFRQKKYREAADLYRKVGDLYYTTRSLYRAGEKERFESALNDLIKRNDPRAGYILNAVAADRRREKEFDDALKIYRDVRDTYPSESEEATWGIGWTLYLSGDHQGARDVFSRLNAQYNDPKYLYWEARCTEALGGDPAQLYARLMKSGNNFYAVLAVSRSRALTLSPVSLDRRPGGSSFTPPVNERIDALLDLGMRSEAVAELVDAGKNIDSPEDLEYLLMKYYEIGEFRRAIGLATKLPYSEDIHRYWYPLAFWDIVEETSRRNGLEPQIALSVMREESRFDPVVKSPAGAYGLMQLMPQTAYRLDRSLKIGITRPAQLTDAKNNILLGTYYLKQLLNEFNNSLPHALAAYNAGEIAVRAWERRGGCRPADEFIEDIPYSETRNYVKKVLTSYFQYRRSTQNGSGGTDFDLFSGPR